MFCTVRTAVRVLLVVVSLATTAPAHAEVGVGFFAQATRYADQPNRNFGVALELAGRPDTGAEWQYFAEVAIAAVSFGSDFTDGVAGTMVRGGLGLRYRARRFSIADVDFDLGFEGVAAVQDIEWSRGGRDVRPELAAGFAWSFTARAITFRTSVRAFFTSAPTSPLACRGPCMTDDAIASGYMLVTGFAW